MVFARFGWSLGVVALAAALCSAASADAANKPDKRAQRGHFATNSIGSFTPAAADPRAAALLSRSGIATGFRFTPSATPGRRRAVTVAVRSTRTVPGRNAPAAARGLASISADIATPINPVGYNLGAAVGWKRFALLGDVTHVDTGVLPGGRDLVDLGLSYTGRRWTGRLQVGADHSLRDETAPVGRDKSYSVDVIGSYALTRNLDVTGGVRYKSQRDWLEQLDDQRRDSQTVYLGTAFRF